MKNKENQNPTRYSKIESNLKIDCSKCSGLCCTALYCMKTDGFPANKEAGVPCTHLCDDFKCDMHGILVQKNMRGCTSYDCFGAGQKVTQYYNSDVTWKSVPEQAEKIFDRFHMVFQLHQMEWYLLEAYELTQDERLRTVIAKLINENVEMTQMSDEKIRSFNMEAYRMNVNTVLKQIIKNTITDSERTEVQDYIGKDLRKRNLSKRDFGMALLIAANLEGCNLNDTCFLGADMRDTNVRNADLRSSLFLTQMQINGAAGNQNTLLPDRLTRPISWNRN